METVEIVEILEILEDVETDGVFRVLELLGAAPLNLSIVTTHYQVQGKEPQFPMSEDIQYRLTTETDADVEFAN